MKFKEFIIGYLQFFLVTILVTISHISHVATYENVHSERLVQHSKV